MKPEWKKYTGSDEQIAEIRSNEHGYMLMNNAGHISEISCNLETNGLRSGEDRRLMFNCSEVSHYLICEPHPYADMICQWARTGQPVWVRYAKVCHFGQTSEYEICNQIATLTPDWNIPGAEYSFTPFEGEL